MKDVLRPFGGSSLARRTWLQLGLGGLAGGSLPGLLGLVRHAEAGESRGGGAAAQRRPANCILIWLDGGPTHLDTFDPKPGAPVEVRGPFGTVPTTVSGFS